MTPRMVVACIASMIIAGCKAEPVGPRSTFEGVITSRQPFLYGVQGGGVDSIPGMLVETDPGSPADPLCSNAAAFFLRNLERLAFANGRPARLDDLAVGVRVRVWWSGIQLDSCPPKRGADIVLILP